MPEVNESVIVFKLSEESPDSPASSSSTGITFLALFNFLIYPKVQSTGDFKESQVSTPALLLSLVQLAQGGWSTPYPPLPPPSTGTALLSDVEISLPGVAFLPPFCLLLSRVSMHSRERLQRERSVVPCVQYVYRSEPREWCCCCVLCRAFVVLNDEGEESRLTKSMIMMMIVVMMMGG